MLRRVVGAAAFTVAWALSPPAQSAGHKMLEASASLKAPDGKDIGVVALTQTANGVLLIAELWDFPAGTHAFHNHAVGKCEPPFKSAKGHFNPGGRKHGILVKGGLHAGDMPNIEVPASGALTIEVLNPNVTLAKGKPNSVFDADGSAIVMHMKGDDYKSQPSGAAGSRIACGVIK